MGLFSKAKASSTQQQQHTELVTSNADPERPPLKTSASAPEGDMHLIGSSGGGGGAAGGLQQQQQPGGSSEHADHVQRSQSEPAKVKQRLPQKDTMTEEQRQTLAHLQMLTKVMDNAITIPVIKKKFGLDAMIGLIPYAGDMAGATVGTYIITRALKYHMPKRLVLRMMANQAIDSAVGVIPFVGDIFDFGFKANTRNMKLLQEHLEHPKQAKRADTCFLITLFFLVVVVPVVLVVGTVAAIVLGILAALGRLG